MIEAFSFHTDTRNFLAMLLLSMVPRKRPGPEKDICAGPLTQLCNPTAYLNLPPTSFFRPCAKVLFFQYPENFSGPTLKFRTWPFWGINGNGNHWVQTCETNIWWIFKPLALIHANKRTPSPNSWPGRIRI